MTTINSPSVGKFVAMMKLIILLKRACCAGRHKNGARAFKLNIANYLHIQTHSKMLRFLAVSVFLLSAALCFKTYTGYKVTYFICHSITTRLLFTPFYFYYFRLTQNKICLSDLASESEFSCRLPENPLPGI